MAYTILTQIETPQVKQAAKRLRLNADELVNIYFDSGIEYLDILQLRIRRKRTFDAMFRHLISHFPDFGKMGPHAAMQIMRTSPAFWGWWSAQFWCICRQGAFADQTELFYRLQFNDALIPHFVLKQIFHVKQNTNGQQRAADQPADKAAEAINPSGATGKRVEYPVR